MSQTIETQFGPGTVVDRENVRGVVSYKVEGAGFSTWIDAASMPMDFEYMPDPEDIQNNSTTLPYNPEPQAWTNPTEQNIQPNQKIDPGKRTSPADSVDFTPEGDSSVPGPDPSLFATAGLSPEDIQAKLGPKYVNAFVEHDFTSLQARIEENPEMVLAEYRERVADLVYDTDENYLEEVGQSEFLEASDAQIREAAWRDVAAKARRLRHSGQVMTRAATPEVIASQVTGDHGTYDVLVVRSNIFQGSGAVDSWSCSCPWGQWAFKREHNFVGRLCSHAYASLMELQAMHRSKSRFKNPVWQEDAGWTDVLPRFSSNERTAEIVDLRPVGWDPYSRNLMNRLKELWEEGSRPGKQNERNQEIQDLVSELRDRGFATDGIVASLNRTAGVVPEGTRLQNKNEEYGKVWVSTGESGNSGLSGEGTSFYLESNPEIEKVIPSGDEGYYNVLSSREGIMASLRESAWQSYPDYNEDGANDAEFLHEGGAWAILYNRTEASGGKRWFWHILDSEGNQRDRDGGGSPDKAQAQADAESALQDYSRLSFIDRPYGYGDIPDYGTSDEYVREHEGPFDDVTRMDFDYRPGTDDGVVRDRNDGSRALTSALKDAEDVVSALEANGWSWERMSDSDFSPTFRIIGRLGSEYIATFTFDQKGSPGSLIEAQVSTQDPLGWAAEGLGNTSDLNEALGWLSQYKTSVFLPRGTQVNRLNMDGSNTGEVGVVSKDYNDPEGWDPIFVKWNGGSTDSQEDLSLVAWGEYEDGTPTKRLDDPWNIHGGRNVTSGSADHNTFIDALEQNGWVVTEHNDATDFHPVFSISGRMGSQYIVRGLFSKRATQGRFTEGSIATQDNMGFPKDLIAHTTDMGEALGWLSQYRTSAFLLSEGRTADFYEDPAARDDLYPDLQEEADYAEQDYSGGDFYDGGEDPYYVDPMEREDYPEEDVVANFQRNAGWIMQEGNGDSGGDGDIAAAAAAHLRTAGRQFTMAEQQALIDEDDGNPYDRSQLDLRGTHYL